MGSSEYLMQVQDLAKADTAGIAQPQTLQQKLRYELEARQEEELDALQDAIGAAYSTIEGGDLVKFLTYDATRARSYDARAPKRYTLEDAKRKLLEGPERTALLLEGTAPGSRGGALVAAPTDGAAQADATQARRIARPIQRDLDQID